MEEFALCVIPVAFLVTIFGTIVLVRWFKHREIIAMVEKGLLPERYARYVGASSGRSGRGLMGWGVALTALGLALMLGLWPISFARVGVQYPLNFGPWMLIGLIPLFMGLALLIIYFLVRREDASAVKLPGKLAKPSESLDEQVEAPDD